LHVFLYDHRVCTGRYFCTSQDAYALSAVRKGDLDEVRRLVAGGTNQNASYLPGFTARHYAQIRGYREIADYLLSHGDSANAPMPSPGALTAWRLQGLDRTDSPGVVVLVVREGRVLFSRAAGMANIERGTPATLETRFRIGSVTKQFTAAAILRLQEQGELSLTDPLSTFFPDLPNADRITIHHLLTHTSGLHSYTSKPDFIERVTKGISPEDLIAYFKDDPVDFEPGQRWSYCNSGYFLLGQIVAQVSGREYGEFLRTEFFQPLGMSHTGVFVRGRDIGPEAAGLSGLRIGICRGRAGRALCIPPWAISRNGTTPSLVDAF